ncbi:hypothetical protein C8F01DRAFT_1152478 [Mycena amicta]|nr:hypothetical protein C8F01DRAFT_1152478 [Mycena amicta]
MAFKMKEKKQEKKGEWRSQRIHHVRSNGRDMSQITSLSPQRPPWRKKFRFTSRRRRRCEEPVVPEYDIDVDVLSFASDSEDEGGGTESESEDVAMVDAIRANIGQSLSAAQLDALAEYSSRHKSVAWTRIDAESKQLTLLLRKLRKTNAVITEEDCELIDATAPASSMQIHSASGSSAAARISAPTSAARRAAIASYINPAPLTQSAVQAEVAARQRSTFLRVLNELAGETRWDCWVWPISCTPGTPLAYRDAMHKRAKKFSSAANLLGMTKKQIAAMEWHANAVVMIDHPEGAGRDLVVFEPNVTGVEARENSIRRIFQPWMGGLLVSDEIRPRYARLWAICLPLVLEWMIEVVTQGLVMQRAANGDVESIRGFRQVAL